VTVEIDLGEFLTAYTAEAEEHLAAATRSILRVDAAARKGEPDPRGVRDLFRAVHTIKGLSSMVGVEPVVTVAHRLETVLRAADTAGGAIASEVADVVLQAIRLMEQSVRAVERGLSATEPPATLLATLDSLSFDVATPRAHAAARLTLDAALEGKLEPFERELLLKGAIEGRRAIRLDYAPTPSRAALGLNINSVRERVETIAEIVRVIPISIPPSEQVPASIAFALLLLTSRSDSEVAAAAGVNPSDVKSIVEVDGAGRNTELVEESDARSSALELRADDVPRRNLLRVDASRIDAAMDRLANLIVTRSRFSRAIEKLTSTGADTREITQIAGENARQLRDLRASILQVRMVPLTDILERIPLMIRSLMRSSGRQVRLEVEAGDAELDKTVGERIFPAIVHLVRNAVDHGIEPPADRARAGKLPEGTVRITCSAHSNTRLELTIEDDGSGVDAEAVAAKAGTAVPTGDVELLELLCRPGLSTRDEATTTSGRGLGMDIVKRIVVDELGGELSLQTRRSMGTTFSLRIPLTVAIVDAFVVECARQRFVVPVTAVEEIMVIDASTVTPAHGRSAATAVRPAGMLARRGETVPLYPLKALLGLSETSTTDNRALVVRRSGEAIGVLFERVLGQQEAVIRPLHDPLVRVRGIPATTDLGDGRPTIVLDLVALGGHALRPSHPLRSAPSFPALSGRAAAHQGGRP
jgi:two-component system, chemotaxis family, sensor kinase CheA